MFNHSRQHHEDALFASAHRDKQEVARFYHEFRRGQLETSPNGEAFYGNHALSAYNAAAKQVAFLKKLGTK